MNNKYIISLMVLLMIAIPSLAGTGTISIYGTNVSNAQANVTVTGVNDSVNVTAWNVGGSNIKTWYVNVTNASDILTLNIYNITVSQVNELKINSVSIDGYSADSNGLVTFTITQATSNYTFDLRPSVNQGGYNSTWARIKNLYVTTLTTLFNVTIYNATTVQGDGSGLYNLVFNNVTGLQATWDNQANNETRNVAAHANMNLTVSNLNSTLNLYSLNLSNGTGILPSSSYGTSIVIANISDYSITVLNASNITTGTIQKGRLTRNVTNISTNYSALATDDVIVFYNATALNDFIVTLPTSTTGVRYDIKNKNNNGKSVSIQGTGGQLVEGALWANITTAGNSITFIGENNEWSII